MSMLKELIQEKNSREKSKSNERGVCPILRGIAHILCRPLCPPIHNHLKNDCSVKWPYSD
jgi:hypothetical protein